MTIVWRINALAVRFAAGWIVVALAVERSELLFQSTGLRVAVGVLLALVGELWREGLAVVRCCGAPAAEREKADTSVLGGEGAAATHEDAAMHEAAATHEDDDCTTCVRRDEDVASTRAALTPERVWTKARGMVHNEMPDYESDRAYLSLVRSAANGGHPEALRKLGEYAFRRGSCVEAAYWEFQACRLGATEDDGFMDMYAEQWVENGCPDEDEFVCEAFTPEQSSFGRSVLRFHSGTDVSLALGRFAEKARNGDADAVAFLKWAGAE